MTLKFVLVCKFSAQPFRHFSPLPCTRATVSSGCLLQLNHASSSLHSAQPECFTVFDSVSLVCLFTSVCFLILFLFNSSYCQVFFLKNLWEFLSCSKQYSLLLFTKYRQGVLYIQTLTMLALAQLLLGAH